MCLSFIRPKLIRPKVIRPKVTRPKVTASEYWWRFLKLWYLQHKSSTTSHWWCMNPNHWHSDEGAAGKGERISDRPDETLTRFQYPLIISHLADKPESMYIADNFTTLVWGGQTGVMLWLYRPTMSQPIRTENVILLSLLVAKIEKDVSQYNSKIRPFETVFPKSKHHTQHSLQEKIQI